jgi:hypothetical protein
LLQGVLKKIQLERLPADLLLKLGYPPRGLRKRIQGRRCSQIRRHRSRHDPSSPKRHALSLGRTTTTANSDRTAKPEPFPPLVKTLAQYTKLARQGTHILASRHPSQRSQLEFLAEPSRRFL